MLIAKNIYKSHSGHTILDGVDIAIAPGEISVLIGPSGAGKTTLLRALALIDPPDRGTVSIDAQEFIFPIEAPITPPWPKLSVVFQQLFLWPHLTLRENILLPARNIANPQMEAELEDLIGILDMSRFIDRYPNQASLGQRQRVALARAIMLHPKYLLMDEITSALDVEQVGKIVTYLPLLRERGIGVLLITHLINFARRTADKILFLDQGHILEEGAPKLVLDNPQTQRLQQFLSVIEEAS